MNRQEKEQEIAQLNHDFKATDTSFLVGYKGLSVAQMSDLRKKLREQGGLLHVAKITLIKRAIDNIEAYEPLRQILKEQLALVFVQNAQMPVIAKVLYDFSKENEQLVIEGGISNATLMSQAVIKNYATLPSREVLLAQLCWLLKSPLVKMALLLKELERTKKE